MAVAGRRLLRRGRSGRLAPAAGVIAAAAVLAAAVPGAMALAASAPRAAGFPSGQVVIDGHGWGPGVGMGQWGAFGYAAVQHETYQWILSHFYGGSTLATLPAAEDGNVSVAILENAGYAVTVTSPSAFTFGGVSIPAGTAARASIDPSTGLFTLATAASCKSPEASWQTLKSGLADPVAVPASLAAAAPAADLLTLCRGDGVDEGVRGSIEAYDYDNANTGDKPLARTVNTLPLEQYVADVVPSESSTGWGEVGGAGPQSEPWGFQELEAQAVAARTYLLAYETDGGWSGYADICDSDVCQSYPGVVNESTLATAAVKDTAGRYLEDKGSPVDAQYSASTGGYTAPSSFPAVVDAGDSVCLEGTGLWTCNSEHDWAVSVPVATVEAAFSSIGTLESITATSRNGLGAWGGRVLTIRIVGSKGTVNEAGTAFESQFDLYSNWFLITHPAAPTTTTTTTTTAPPTTSSTSTTTTTTTLPPLPGNPWAHPWSRRDPYSEGTGPLPRRAPPAARRLAERRG